MAKMLKKIAGNPNISYYEFVCDTEDDLPSIETARVPMGSTCYVIDSGITYILNGQKEWKKYTGSSATSGEENGGSGGSSEEVIIYDGGSSSGN